MILRNLNTIIYTRMGDDSGFWSEINKTLFTYNSEKSYNPLTTQ